MFFSKDQELRQILGHTIHIDICVVMQVLMFCEECVFIKVNPVCNPYPDQMEPGVHRYGYPPFFHFYDNEGACVCTFI